MACKIIQNGQIFLERDLLHITVCSYSLQSVGKTFIYLRSVSLHTSNALLSLIHVFFCFVLLSIENDACTQFDLLSRETSSDFCGQ